MIASTWRVQSRQKRRQEQPFGMHGIQAEAECVLKWKRYLVVSKDSPNYVKEAKHSPKWPEQAEIVWRPRGMRGMHQKLSGRRALCASEVGSSTVTVIRDRHPDARVAPLGPLCHRGGHRRCPVPQPQLIIPHRLTSRDAHQSQTTVYTTHSKDVGGQFLWRNDSLDSFLACHWDLSWWPLRTLEFERLSSSGSS